MCYYLTNTVLVKGAINLKIAIVVDSSLDFPVGYTAEFPIHILPLRVYIDGNEYRDKIDISDEAFYTQALAGKKVSTSMPSVGEATRLLSELCREYEHVYVVTISSKLSGTHDMLAMVIEQLGVKNATLLDSKSGSVKSFYFLHRLIRDLSKGKKVSTTDTLEYVRESQLLFTVLTLDFLKKGGRIGKAKALLGKVLKIKPILSTDLEGEVHSVANHRSIPKVIEDMVKKSKNFVRSKDFIVIGGYGVEYMKKHLDELLSYFDKSKILGIARIGPAVSAHVGPEVFGLVAGLI